MFGLPPPPPPNGWVFLQTKTNPKKGSSKTDTATPVRLSSKSVDCLTGRPKCAHSPRKARWAASSPRETQGDRYPFNQKENQETKKGILSYSSGSPSGPKLMACLSIGWRVRSAERVHLCAKLGRRVCSAEQVGEGSGDVPLRISFEGNSKWENQRFWLGHISRLREPAFPLTGENHTKPLVSFGGNKSQAAQSKDGSPNPRILALPGFPAYRKLTSCCPNPNVQSGHPWEEPVLDVSAGSTAARRYPRCLVLGAQ